MRLDAGALALAGGYAFDSGLLDEEDIMFVPGVAIEVRGDPNRALMPLLTKEPPGSSFQETSEIKSDITQTVGLGDAIAGQAQEGTGESTATGALLVAATVTRRVEAQSRRLETETVRSAARLFLALDQRNILQPRDVREMLGPDPENPNVSRWRWFKIGPGELMGEFEVVPEGGTMQARDVQRDAFQANALLSALGQNPHIDQRRLLLRVIHLLGIDDAQGMMAPPVTPIPPETLQVLEQMGVPKDTLAFALAKGQQMNPQLPAPHEQADSPQEMAA
jgi:hypothetical protein